ncbi:hypothetical protein [Burkholderia ubonensis]|uniref:hypothetical protein n=1 Tax=Burkholderia ubonensis TaxID=101571 RepID=UPI000AEF69DB|nr:hypothetical protein [Burkholderia ubonensis]
MVKVEVPDEKLLQKWFENTAKQNEICASIDNIEELRAKVDALALRPRQATANMHAALTRALHICDVLRDVRIIGANESIAPPDCTSMRPDVVLVTPAAQYLLIELKTKANAERQGVQELLAYSTAVRLQAHHVNDFIYIIVANDWGTLLSYGVRAMVMDGKYVLPLKCSQTKHGFRLSINLDLFKVQFTRPYIPDFALAPATLSIQRRVPRLNESVLDTRRLDRYFRSIAVSAKAECTRLQQSGFVMVWRHPTPSGLGPKQEMVNLTLFTVNQHWRAGEFTPDEHHPLLQDPDKRPNLEGLHLRRYHEVYASEAEHHPAPSEDDVFAVSARQVAIELATEGIFPQSTFSADVLSRLRSRRLEQEIERNRDWFGDFEPGDSILNLNHFYQGVVSWPGAVWMQIFPFWTFGDLADFAESEHALPTPQDFYGLRDYLDAFNRYKAGENG